MAERGKNLSEDRVRQIVEDTLKNYGLNQSVTADQINVIVNFAIHLSNSGVITNGQFVETLNDLKASIVSKANGTFDHIDLHFDANQALDKGKGIWQQIMDFSSSLLMADHATSRKG